ncbi:MAG: HAD family hydrolase [Firmicutes bacterium]|nr:HAD family hydrolase [Bacillota bacterium]
MAKKPTLKKAVSPSGGTAFFDPPARVKFRHPLAYEKAAVVEWIKYPGDLSGKVDGVEVTYQYILFDLDGTLTDPGAGIINSVLYALRRYGIEGDPHFLRRFVGPPLINSFMEFYGFTEEQAREAVEFYREYYRERGIFENRLYPGIPELLATLTERGKQLALATSKPTVFARQVLTHFQLHHYFAEEMIVGSYLDGRRTNKAEVIAAVLALLPPEREKAVMVGDRKYDVEGARANGIAAIGVTYGYGEVAELERARPAQIAHSVPELLNFLL